MLPIGVPPDLANSRGDAAPPIVIDTGGSLTLVFSAGSSRLHKFTTGTTGKLKKIAETDVVIAQFRNLIGGAMKNGNIFG
jgi:hypothetical protein